MKIVWICHFTNNDIQKKLGIKKRINEFAPWINIGINEAKKRDDIELHVISPHRWLRGIREFKEDDIHYHFFNPGMPFTGRQWPDKLRFDIYTCFFSNRRRILNFIEKINPEIIHLHGAENDYYSSVVFDIPQKYPVLMTVQGFLKTPLGKVRYSLKKRLENEKRVISRLKHFGVRTSAMVEEIKKLNSTAVFHWHEYFLNTPDDLSLIPESEEKKYDMIFFSRISKAKGIEDFITIFGNLRSKHSELRAAIIGLSSPVYLEELKELAVKNNCSENIDFLGFLPTQEDVYDVVSKSKVFVLPTYNDALPGSIMECMFRKIPVVTYYTGGIPEINKDDKNIIIVEQGDLKAMEEKVEFLLKDEDARNSLAKKAYNFACNKWNNKLILDDIINIYKKIIKDGTKK